MDGHVDTDFLSDPQTLGMEVLVEADEGEAAAMGFGGATGAIEIQEAIWVGSFTGERIGKFVRSDGTQ